MRILFDTNLLTRMSQTGHAHCLVANAVYELQQAGHEICLVPQVLYEYWVVMTRPLGQNGLGLGLIDAEQDLDDWLAIFTLLPDQPAIFSL